MTDDTDSPAAIAALTTTAFCQLLEAGIASKYLYENHQTNSFRASLVNVATNSCFSLFRAGMSIFAGYAAGVNCEDPPSSDFDRCLYPATQSNLATAIFDSACCLIGADGIRNAFQSMTEHKRDSGYSPLPR